MARTTTIPLLSALLLFLLLLSAPSTALPQRAPQPRALTTSSLPSSGLPDPSTLNLTLKHIALGLGTQNYTCANLSSTPVSTGALATLYDAFPLLSSSAPSTVATLPVLAYSTQTSLGLTSMGRHFFSGGGTPMFEFWDGEVLEGRKEGEVKAPEGSVAGSVDWLFLGDDGKDGSRGLRAVYRVETAGGAAETCEGVGEVEVAYAAEYWFFD